jgi:hypothetical protein
VQTDDVTRLTDTLAGVRRTAPEGLAEWRCGDAGAIEDALASAWQRFSAVPTDGAVEMEPPGREAPAVVRRQELQRLGVELRDGLRR